MKEKAIKAIKNPMTYVIVLLIWTVVTLSQLENRLATLESSLGYIGKDAEDAAKSASSCYGVSLALENIKDDIEDYCR